VLWGHAHTHSSPPTQAIFGTFQGPAQQRPLAALFRARRSRPIKDQFILTNHRSAYSDQSQTTQQPRGPEKQVSTLTAEEVLPSRYHYKCNLTVQPNDRNIRFFVPGRAKDLSAPLYFLCFVDRTSPHNLVNKTNLVHNLFFVYLINLHASGDYGPIIRRNNCVYQTVIHTE